MTVGLVSPAEITGTCPGGFPDLIRRCPEQPVICRRHTISLFLQDPRNCKRRSAEALSLLNADEATAEAFADKTEAQEGLDLIVMGLKASRATEADGAFVPKISLVDEYQDCSSALRKNRRRLGAWVYTDREQSQSSGKARCVCGAGCANTASPASQTTACPTTISPYAPRCSPL